MMRIVGNKLMAVCSNCGKIVRADKPILGGTHICTTEEEQKLYAAEIHSRVAKAKAELAKA